MLSSSIVNSLQSSMSGMYRYGGNLLPHGAIFRTGSDGVDIIGLSVSDYTSVDESIRGNFFSAPDTKRSDAEILAIAYADPLLNAGTMIGIIDETLVLYPAGTSETILNKALKAIRAKTELVDSLEMLDSLVLIGA